MITLRPYQSKAIDNLREKYKAHKRLLCVSFTGSGKTLIACEIIKKAKVPVLFLAHKMEILNQTHDKLKLFGVDSGIIRADDPRRNDSFNVQVASVQTLWRRKYRPPAGLIVVDECHRVMGDTYKSIIADYPNAYLLGLSATPIRLDNKGLGDFFSEMVLVETMTNLVNDGYLVPCRTFAPSEINLGKIRKTGGDYNQKDLAECMLGEENKKLYGDIFDHWQKHAKDRQTIVFATSIEHSKKIVEYLNNRNPGIALHIDGEMDEKTRTKTLNQFCSGNVKIISNCDLLCEGVDIPAISCVIQARPTLSLTKFMQSCGRGMRPFPGKKDLIILDHVGNSIYHGPPNMDREWSLTETPKKNSGDRCWLCIACGAVNSLETTACENCGTALSRPETTLRQQRKLIQNKDGELIELYAGNEARKPLRQCDQCQGSIYNGVSKNIAKFGRFTFLAKCPSCGKTNFWPDKQAAKYATESERTLERQRLELIAQKKGLKKGWVWYRMKDAGFRV